MLCALLAAAPAAASGRHPLSAHAPSAGDALTRALARGELSEAQYALERARSVFRLGTVRARFGDVERPGPRDATMILRDLALALPRLTSSEQREARAVLARPTGSPAFDGEPQYEDGLPVRMDCISTDDDPEHDACVHWVESAPDAPPLGDSDSDTIPDWVETTQAVVADVWQQEIGSMGYREPLPDDDPTGTFFDVYLMNLGDDGVFGYCTTDDPNASPGSTYEYWDFSAYCVLDNDYAEFGLDPLDALSITAAHEFFHAVQFAYDASEDAHFMEGTATWIEDELYDQIDDNRVFLAYSALTRPSRPVGYNEGWFEYGSWIFYRFLSEHFADREIIHEIWANADGSAAGRNDYSLRAITRAVRARDSAFGALFAKFGRVNRTPGRFYEEGSNYPTPPLSSKYAIGRKTPTTGWKAPRARHLASRYYAFKPSRSAKKTSKLKVTVDLPRRKYASAATLVVRYRGGASAVRAIDLNRYGDGSRKVDFGRGKVARVELVLSNASTRIDAETCWTETTAYSCRGAVALDDSRKFRFRGDLR